MYERVAKLDVFLWGRHVGALAPESGSYHVFQYDPAFVRSGLEISPLTLPLRTELYRTSLMNLPKGVFWGLPGRFAAGLRALARQVLAAGTRGCRAVGI